MIPGARLFHHKSPVCLEHDKRLCGRPADYEVRSMFDGTWGAKCAKCIKYYNPAHCEIRDLTEEGTSMHILVQLRDGTLKQEYEPTIATLARVGGVSVGEYLDLAAKHLDGDDTLRAALAATFPKLRLEVWVRGAANRHKTTKARLDELAAEAGKIIGDATDDPF